MIANSAIRNLIREAKAHQMVSIIQTQNGIRHADHGPGAARPVSQGPHHLR
jgi:Tfp pilus assembly pilus retraction ATPase PilT